MAVEIPLGLYADITQLVEYRICNQDVEGSSPPISFRNTFITKSQKGCLTYAFLL